MAFLKCKMCGGELNIDTGSSVAVCEYCGTKQTLPRLDDEKRVQLFDRANHFRRANEFDKAMGVYEMILSDAKDDAEAYWGLVLCRYGITYVEDPKSGKRMPTVNRSQFTSIFDDSDYKSAIEYCSPEQKSLYEAEAKSIDNIHKNFMRIAKDEEPFDVFICYKETDDAGERTQDSVYAYDIYDALTKEGLKVFFARVTLEDKLGSMYEPYIFSALNSAKVMLAIGTKREYFDAVWVKNEWSRFLGLIKEGKDKTIIPVYKDMSPYDMPEEFTYLQSQDMGKIGYIQDLVRGVKKITGFEQKSVNTTPVVAVNEKPKKPVEVIDPDKMIKHAFTSLEGGKWSEARGYAQKAMKANPDKAEPYLCMIMANNKFKSVDELKKNKKVIFDDASYYDFYLKRCKESEKIEVDRKLLVKKKNYTEYKLWGGFLAILSAALILLSLFYYVLNGYIWDTISQMEFKIMFPLIVVCFLMSVYGVSSAKRKSKPIHSTISLLVAFVAFISAFVCFYKVNTDWGPEKRLAEIEEIYSQGDYETAFETCFNYNRYSYSGELFNGVFGKFDPADNAADFYIMAVKCATATAQGYVDKKDYKGLIEFVSDKEYFFNAHLSKIQIMIPEDSYDAYITEVNKLSENWKIGVMEDSYIDYGILDGSMKFYVDLQHDLLHKIPEDSVDTTMIDAVYNKVGELEYCSSEIWLDELRTLFEFKEIQAIYLNDDYICEFMKGKWTNNATYSSAERYIEFYENEKGAIGSRADNLPHPDVEHTYYDVQEQTYVYLDSNSKKICDVYKFTFVDDSTMQCYCYENGVTYTLYRK